jgi:cysteine desulfurase
VVAALDLCGFAASTGAACTSGSVAPSPVLLGIGLSPERAVEAVRFSLGPDNTEEHIQALLEVLPDILVRARQFR